jgi:hypothetical protein
MWKKSRKSFADAPREFEMTLKRMDDIMSVMRYVSTVVVFMAITSLTSPVLLGEGKPSEPSPEVIVYYFHGYQRCWTCRRVEELAHLALVERFSDELETGRLQWQVVNIEAEGYEHFISDFNLVARALVVRRVQERKETDWKNLQRIWELVGDEEEFVKYVQDEVGSLLGEMR